MRPAIAQESAELLRRLGVDESLAEVGAFEEIRGISSRAIPFTHALGADPPMPHGQSQQTLPVDTATLVERYLRLTDVARAVLKCVAARWLDQDVISALVGVRQCPGSWNGWRTPRSSSRSRTAASVRRVRRMGDLGYWQGGQGWRSGVPCNLTSMRLCGGPVASPGRAPDPLRLLPSAVRAAGPGASLSGP